MNYKKVYVLFERHSKNGDVWFKTHAPYGYVDLSISDEWYKVNEVRNRRFKELKECALRCNDFKDEDFCDENYSILHKGGLKIELIIDTKILR